MFEESVKGVLQESVAVLPAAFTRDDFVRELNTYLEYSGKPVRLTSRFKVNAIDVPRYYDPQRYPELLKQTDFRQWAEPLLADANLRMLDPPMQKLRKLAVELGIDWNAATSVIRRAADQLRPDQRPAAIQRGEFCERIIEELRRIREGQKGFRTFEELERIYPNYEVVHILRDPPFESEDRETLVRPHRWERVVTYATLILMRYFKKSEHTINRDRKQFKASIRPRKSRNNQNR
jgi:hypothetical protein